ncbi:hypothetical protein GOZ78_03420 [Agrobacterium vitis]|uniref:Uncharacterized protein n=1 Tax=Agrobacterium vitis TaxID=373 RepID=A0A1S2E2J0_AGRVI|nr:hypothetical protein [Agrobacterium vitis]KAA3526139.1 hypothetical protein DXT89_16575 [Agrobacterium vitis]MUO96591.1 hypothetical protein [Agrobacterium vitis]MUZ80799.1 hypothetical protein [Agrobacterium vitis]MUZ99350.1 hypothetical protein [Agrobacterium vitis]MVA09068.1 hypothetical protein [Agrobacterium vitis]
MAIKRLQANATWNTGVSGRIDAGYRMLKYSGSLGGGTLSVSSKSLDLSPVDGVEIETPLPNAKLTVSKVDGNNDVVQQLVLQTSGEIVVILAGATNPDVLVIVE